MKHIITEKILEKYKKYLREEEKSIATISKYIRDIRKLADYAGKREITKKLVLDYKEDLRINKKYKLSSINSFLIAVNRFLEYMGWYGMRVKTYSIQREVFAPAGRDLSLQEYRKLVYAAKYKGKKIILNKCTLSDQDVSDFEYETNTKVFYNLPPLYDQESDNAALDAFLVKLGFVRQSAGETEKKKGIFGLFNG